MEWKKVSPELVEVLDSYLQGYAAERRKMFGCPTWFVNGNMFAGVHQDSLFIRLSAEDREAAFAFSDEIAPFEPVKGQVMKEYVVFPEHLLAQRELFRQWLDRSYAYVSSLPPKEKKAARTK